ncbi:MAG: hypothetical protein RLZZ50_953 [Verrucomicrobiota bacterium]|jgi:hypothetical protein
MNRRLPGRIFVLVLSFLAIGAAIGCAPRKPETDPPGASDGARRLAEQLDADFARIRGEVERLAVFISGLYARQDELVAKVDTAKYAFAANGAFHKTADDGGAALWISAVEPITDQVRRVAYFTEAADPELIAICRRFPEVSQAYYNDRHSLNRIYPWFDTIAQYPARMNIPEYNFYYLADAAHNPARGGVWVDEPYVDPAGRGWMVSAIAPVYVDGRLEGVPGLDVTIATLANRYLHDDGRAIAVISRQGVLVAATERAIQHLEMPPLKDHKYLETVKLDTFKPDEYNILKSTIRPVRAMAKEILEKEQGELRLELMQDGSHTVCFTRMKELGWTVVEITPP